MDADARRTKSFTWIPGIRLRDFCGHLEHGSDHESTERAPGHGRRGHYSRPPRPLEATRALRDQGAVPPGVEDASVYTVRSCLTVLPAEAD